MVYSSLLFIYGFFPLSLLLFYVTPKKMRELILLLLSMVGSAPGLPLAGRQQMPVSGVGVPPHGALGIAEPAGPAALPNLCCVTELQSGGGTADPRGLHL